MVLPIFRSTPVLERGIPVSLAIFCFACDIPKALSKKKKGLVLVSISLP